LLLDELLLLLLAMLVGRWSAGAASPAMSVLIRAGVTG
jgi:hypothetical protein